MIDLDWNDIPFSPNLIRAESFFKQKNQIHKIFSSVNMIKLPVNSIEPFDFQFDFHLFLQTSTIIGLNKSRDLFIETKWTK